MAQEKALREFNAEFEVSDEERERLNDFVFINYAKKKLAEAKAYAAANPDAWINSDELMAKWEQLDREDGIL